MCVMTRFFSKPYPRKQILVRYVAAINIKDLKNIDIDDDYTFVHQRDAWNWIHSTFGYNSAWKVFERTFQATIKETKRPKECPRAKPPKHTPDPNSRYIISYSPQMALFVSEYCAGNMEQDLQTALKRDQRMRKKADAYKRLPHLKWKYSYSGNPYIKYHGFIATVFKKKGPQIYSNNLGFGIIIKHKDSCYSRFSERYYPSKDQAKLEALKTILKVEEKYGEDYDKWLTKGQFETDFPYG